MSPRESGEPGVTAAAPFGRDPILRVLERVVHDGIVLLEPGSRDVLYANAAACRLLEVPEDPGEVAAALRPLLAAVGPSDRVRIELPGREPPRSILVEITPVDEDECRGSLVVLKDARAVEVLEEDIFLANRMRALGEMYLSLAHDLKTPLNAVALNLDVLRSAVAESVATHDEDPAGDEALEIVDAIRDEMVRLQRSLQAFLVQASPPSLARRRFDLRRLVREVVKLVLPLADGRGVRLRVAAGDGPLPVHGYRDRLRQALRNVVVNAVEASPRLGEVLVDVRSANGSVVVLVRDAGPGFPHPDVSRLCRLHYTTKEAGSGIGLFVARAAVLAHGGAIRLRNAQGGGAEVELRFPAARDGEGAGKDEDVEADPDRTEGEGGTP